LVTLQDGRLVEDVLIVGGIITEVRGYESIPFSAKDISDITVTHCQHRHRCTVPVAQPRSQSGG
jgi:hypothetical protein